MLFRFYTHYIPVRAYQRSLTQCANRALRHSTGTFPPLSSHRGPSAPPSSPTLYLRLLHTSVTPLAVSISLWWVSYIGPPVLHQFRLFMEVILAPTQSPMDPSAPKFSQSLTPRSQTSPTTPEMEPKTATSRLESVFNTPTFMDPSPSKTVTAAVTAAVATLSSPELQSPKRPPRQQRPPTLRVIPVNDSNGTPFDTPWSPRRRRNSAKPQPTPRSTSNQIKAKHLFVPKLPRRASSLDDIHLMYQHSSPFFPGATFETFEQTLPHDLFLPSLPSGVPKNGIIGALSQATLPATATTTTGKRAPNAYARRWHALMELLTTELGYLDDLRILVEIYLEQLGALTTIPLEARTSISRNTQDIYHFHQSFAAEMDAVVTGERVKTIKAKNASTTEARRIERAIQKVCASFADKVNPSLYT